MLISSLEHIPPKHIAHTDTLHLTCKELNAFVLKCCTCERLSTTSPPLSCVIVLPTAVSPTLIKVHVIVCAIALPVRISCLSRPMIAYADLGSPPANEQSSNVCEGFRRRVHTISSEGEPVPRHHHVHGHLSGRSAFTFG